MSSIELRGGVTIEDPLAVVLAFVEAYGWPGPNSTPGSFAEADLRNANRGGARIAGTEIDAILARRRTIERRLRAIPARASLAQRSVPWRELTSLFEAFAGIRGVGVAKMTKALHPKRSKLVPLLDSVVQAYLVDDSPPAEGFGERATELVRSYKRDLDGNRAALRELDRELRRSGRALTELRILDILIWSAETA